MGFKEQMERRHSSVTRMIMKESICEARRTVRTWLYRNLAGYGFASWRPVQQGVCCVLVLAVVV